jgi:hypothetical protein
VSKKDEGKAEPTLVYYSMIRGLALVRKYGIEKYGKSEDWRSTPSIRHFDALLRHVYAYMSGEAEDVDSGLSHLYHAAANIMFEIERRYGPVAELYKIFLIEDREVVCPRCKTRDIYPAAGVHLCTGGCGYFIEPDILDA